MMSNVTTAVGPDVIEWIKLSNEGLLCYSFLFAWRSSIYFDQDVSSGLPHVTKKFQVIK